MTNFLKPLTWSTDWIKRHYPESSQPPCSLSSCTRPPARWQRFHDRPGGTFLQGAFYCHPGCLEAALIGQLSRLRVNVPSRLPPNRIPLGLLMVARGKLTHVELRAALEAQRRAHYGKIGEWIEKLGFASEQEVTTALGLQWGCPVASSFDPSTCSLSSPVPLSILEAFQMVPGNYAASTNTLSIACGERVDHAALYAIERLLDCRTQACVWSRKSIARQLESMRQTARPHEVEFSPMEDLAEMAQIAASYTARLNPDQVRLGRVGRFLWLRLDVRSKARSNITNLVFRMATETHSTPNVHSLRDLRESLR